MSMGSCYHPMPHGNEVVGWWEIALFTTSPFSADVDTGQGIGGVLQLAAAKQQEAATLCNEVVSYVNPRLWDYFNSRYNVFGFVIMDFPSQIWLRKSPAATHRGIPRCQSTYMPPAGESKMVSCWMCNNRSDIDRKKISVSGYVFNMALDKLAD